MLVKSFSLKLNRAQGQSTFKCGILLNLPLGEKIIKNVIYNKIFIETYYFFDYNYTIMFQNIVFLLDLHNIKNWKNSLKK